MKMKWIKLLSICLLLLVHSVSLAQESPVPAEKVPGPAKTKTGNITVDFKDADIHDVLKIISYKSGLNIVATEDVTGTVTIRLVDVPWEQTLDVILRNYNYTYKKEKNLIRVMTFEKFKQEEKDIPLTTKIIYLNFADVDEMKSALSKLLSARGSIEVDKRTNGMIITDIRAKVDDIEEKARALDTRTPQVMIEAMLIDAKITDEDELGINWKIISTHGVDKREDTADYIEQPASPMSSITSAALKVGWTQRLGEYGIDGLIQAWVKNDKAKILASPKVLTLDNKEAKIEIILEIPYASDMNEQGIVSYKFKEVGTKLYVTPHITPGGFVSMNLKPEMSYQSGTTDDGQPVIDTRKAETNVLVKDGETIVIGGLRRIDDTKTYTKVPFLGDIPLIGMLFRKKDLKKVDTELLMFVTPHIVVKPHIKPEEYEKYKWLEEMTSQKEKSKEKKKKVSLNQ